MTGARKFLDRGITTYIPIVAYAVFTLFPFYWTLNVSFEHKLSRQGGSVFYFPHPITGENYKLVWQQMGFYTYFLNSAIVAIASMILTIILAVLCGYALSRFKFKGKTLFMIMILSTQFIPGAMLLIPLFVIFKNMGLINNLMSLIISNTIFQIPFTAILMRGFISQIPYSLEESAMVDGCTRMSALVRVVFPILLPGIIAVGAFAFVESWNRFEFALMFINSQHLFTLPVGLSYMLGEFDINYGALAAGSVIALVPVVLVFAYIQKYLVAGLGAGAVKG